MKNSVKRWVCFAAFLGVTFSAGAQIIFEAVVSYDVFITGGFAGTAGWVFQPLGNLLVTNLGCYAHVVNEQGPIEVGLWRSDQTLLASRLISSTNTLVNQTFYGEVPPVTLEAGETYHIGAFASSGVIQLGAGGPAFGFTNSVSPDLHLVGYGQNTAVGLSFPAVPPGGADILTLGPNFLYRGGVVIDRPPVISSISHLAEGFLLQWKAPHLGLRYQVQWAPQISGVWSAFPNVVVATNNACSFLDDGSQSGGLGSVRFYRLLQSL